jgi:hypothetical protein
MGLEPGTKITDIKIRPWFHRLVHEWADRRSARRRPRWSKGKISVNDNVYAMIVPGSGLVKEQAEAEGLDKIFKDAGFDWREPGCSMCLGMNPTSSSLSERCASTSNRNFEGRQGFKGARTWSRRPWRPPRRSPATSSISAIGNRRSCGAAPFTACKPCSETRRVEARSKSVPAPYIPDSLSKSVFPAVENGHWKGASWSGPSRGSSSGTCFCWALLPWE